ncbi:unnamed protein product, partial [Gulo gulo]
SSSGSLSLSTSPSSAPPNPGSFQGAGAGSCRSPGPNLPSAPSEGGSSLEGREGQLSSPPRQLAEPGGCCCSRQPGDGEIISEPFPFPPTPPPPLLQDHTGCPCGALSAEPSRLAPSQHEPRGLSPLTGRRGFRVLVKTPARCPRAVPQLLERDAE